MAIRMVGNSADYWSATWPYPYVSEWSGFVWNRMSLGNSNFICWSAQALGSGSTNDSAVFIRPSQASVDVQMFSSTGGSRNATSPYQTSAERDGRWRGEAFGWKTVGAASGDFAQIMSAGMHSGLRYNAGTLTGAKNPYTTFMVGRNVYGANFRPFAGDVGPLSLFRRLITPSEYAYLISGGDPRSIQGIAHHWRFDHPSHQVDEIGNLNLTYTGTARALVANPPAIGRRPRLSSNLASRWISDVAPSTLDRRARVAEYRHLLIR
jgi:hypothetical protein